LDDIPVSTSIGSSGNGTTIAQVRYAASLYSSLAGGKITMSHARVLVVDDEPFARQALSEWLRRMDFHVFEADSGRHAMEWLLKDEPDVIISDMVMPEMDGLQLLEESKALMPDVPFVMVTGYPSHNTAIKVMKQGASDFLAKPFTPEELTRRVNRALHQKEAGRALAPARGIISAAAFSSILWAFIILALAAMLY
jgi:DNA-binding NtrC family response regulator